ncbi:MAG: hypothetical protein F6K04_08975 [Leptolyngbya sp. SIO4C5]|nr:hypothetical protein [Leptolyngbya sp. SIO4C5]
MPTIYSAEAGDRPSWQLSMLVAVSRSAKNPKAAEGTFLSLSYSEYGASIIFENLQ